MTESYMTPEEIVRSYQERFPGGVTGPRIEKRTSGSMKTEFVHLWLQVERSVFKEVVHHLFSIDKYPHFAVCSGYDAGEDIVLVYHFSVFHGERGRELSLNMSVRLPKSNPVIETITDLIPGALISEQEKQEMLGVKIQDIPVDSRVFLADEFPKDVYPWRRDQTGAEKLKRNLHEGET
jgi:membrane-bound hydrogenase subunit beta